MEKRLHPEYNQEHPSGGFRAGYVPPRTSCGVAQLANDAHRIELSHPTRLSVVVQAALDYTALSQNASGGNNIRQRVPAEGAVVDPMEHFEYDATRDVGAGDELFQVCEQRAVHRRG